MKTWYSIRTYGTDIKEVLVESDTDKFIINEHGRRELKTTSGGAIRATKEECRQWRIDYEQNNVDQARKRLESAEADLAEAITIPI
jgi:hypothetical protein